MSGHKCISKMLVLLLSILITTLALTPSWLGCRPPVPHQDHTCCQVPQSGIGGGFYSADPHLWGPGRERLSHSELRPGPDPTARGHLQVRAWHQRWHERAGHCHVLCHHGYALPIPPHSAREPSPRTQPSLPSPSLHPATEQPGVSGFQALPRPPRGVAPAPPVGPRVPAGSSPSRVPVCLQGCGPFLREDHAAGSSCC